MGALLYDVALENAPDWPDWPESATRAELRAVAADLRHASGILASIGQERRVSSLAPGDVRLSKHASGVARIVCKIANSIERRLAKETPS